MNGRIIRLQPLAAANITGTSATVTAFPVTHLADQQPKVVTRFSAGLPATVQIDIDLAADMPVDAVGLLFTNLSADATWEIRGSTAAGGAGPLAGTGSRILGFTGAATARMALASTATRFHCLAIGAPVSVRYLRLLVTEPGNGDGYVQAGLVTVGRASIVPGWNFQWGGGRRVIDMSEKTMLPGGELAIWKGAKVPVARISWGDLSEAERDAMYSLHLEIGESGPLILLEESDPASWRQEQLHYGVHDGLEFYERTQVGKSSWEMRVRNWL